MYKMEIKWKEFNIDLESIELKFRNDYPGYTGNQALPDSLQLWFIEEPSEEIKQNIQNMMDSLTDQSPEALSYRSNSQINQAIQSLKEGIPSKTWNQMNAIERKLVMGLSITKAELITAELL